MHLSVAAADRRANSSFSHTKPQRFFVILIGYCSTSGDLGLLIFFRLSVRVFGFVFKCNI